MNILYLVNKNTYFKKMSRIRFHSIKALSNITYVKYWGLNWANYNNNLSVQENINTLQEAANNATNAELKAKYEQLSIQEAFNATIQKLKILVINLFNKLEAAVANSKVLQFLGLEESDFQFKVDDQEGDQTSTKDGRAVVGQAQNRIPVQDFIIQTHPKDTLVMAGGTQLGNNDTMSSRQAAELIRATKTNRSFNYSGFAAVKEDGHYGTRFS